MPCAVVLRHFANMVFRHSRENFWPISGGLFRHQKLFVSVLPTQAGSTFIPSPRGGLRIAKSLSPMKPPGDVVGAASPCRIELHLQPSAFCGTEYAVGPNGHFWFFNRVSLAFNFILNTSTRELHWSPRGLARICVNILPPNYKLTPKLGPPLRKWLLPPHHSGLFVQGWKLLEGILLDG